jgi:hypothetical protein
MQARCTDRRLAGYAGSMHPLRLVASRPTRRASTMAGARPTQEAQTRKHLHMRMFAAHKHALRGRLTPARTQARMRMRVRAHALKTQKQARALTHRWASRSETSRRPHRHEDSAEA